MPRWEPPLLVGWAPYWRGAFPERDIVLFINQLLLISIVIILCIMIDLWCISWCCRCFLFHHFPSAFNYCHRQWRSFKHGQVQANLVRRGRLCRHSNLLRCPVSARPLCQMPNKKKGNATNQMLTNNKGGQTSNTQPFVLYLYYLRVFQYLVTHHR